LDKSYNKKIFKDIRLFFEKWNYFKLKNPLIESEVLGIKRKLNSSDCYVLVSSLIEKSCLKLLN
tara:strand:+ start:215 stop:406 length:192 start_codon:yes stop_codon:yes gene_type:complete